MTTIPLGETFASFQGEGPRIGRPAVFLRVTRCTLDCAWCDSAVVWKKPGTPYTPQELLTHTNGVFQKLPGASHLLSTYGLVLTGGSPLLYDQLWEPFLEGLPTLTPCPAWVDVETEGVLIPAPFWETWQRKYSYLRLTFNVSPKLPSSGMQAKKAFRQDVWLHHAQEHSYQSIWKFAIATQEDLTAMLAYVQSMNLPESKIWVMPVGSSRAELRQREDDLGLSKFALQHGFNYSTRLQVVLWNEVVGV